MPIHDWSRVDAGLFHDFHQTWTIQIKKSIEWRRSPPAISPSPSRSWAIPCTRRDHAQAAVVTAGRTGGSAWSSDRRRPAARSSIRGFHRTRSLRSKRQNRIVVRHRLGQVVAVIEIISPGNKSSTGTAISRG